MNQKQITVTLTSVSKYVGTPQEGKNWELVMGDDDRYDGQHFHWEAIKKCIEFGHFEQEEADRGTLLVSDLCIEFEVSSHEPYDLKKILDHTEIDADAASDLCEEVLTAIVATVNAMEAAGYHLYEKRGDFNDRGAMLWFSAPSGNRMICIDLTEG